MRDLDFGDLRIYVRIADRGGVAAAARELRVPTSTVSRAIARLELATGTRLFQRTSRTVQMTSEGRALYASVRDAVATLEGAVHALEPAARGPKGTLRVSAPLDLGGAFLADVAVAFTDKHPLVQLDFVLTNRAVNLVQEGVDVAMRAAARLPDSSLVARKVGDLEHALYASPQYLARCGSPSSPAHLAKHRAIVFRAKDLTKTWRLEGGVEPVEIVVRASLGGDDFGYVRAMTIAGGGIALMPCFVCRNDERAGRLVRVLPQYTAKGASLYLVHASAANVPARVRAFVEFVAAAFRSPRS
jgi:DNA-binding transcriptional LysR family regulator